MIDNRHVVRVDLTSIFNEREEILPERPLAGVQNAIPGLADRGTTEDMNVAPPDVNEPFVGRPGTLHGSHRKDFMVGWLMVGVSAPVLAAHALSYPLNHDAAWYLYVAGAVLEGAELYSTIIDINAPLSTYLSMIPVRLSAIAGLPIELAFELSVLLLALAVTAWSAFLVTRVGGASLGQTLAMGLALAFLGLPGTDYGQREHLMVILAAPYAILVWQRISGHSVRRFVAIAAGVAAAVGFSLKPQFVLVWIALEGWCALRTRSRGERGTVRRAEVVTVAVMGLAFAVFVSLRHPAYVELLREARSLYWDFNKQPILLVAAAPVLMPLGLGALALLQRLGPASELARVYLVFSIATYFVFVIQGKGWTYHEYPVVAGVLVFTILFAYDVAVRSARGPGDDIRMRVSAVGLAVATVMVASTTLSIQTEVLRWKDALLTARSPFFQQLPEGTGVVMLTDLMEDAFPLVTLADVEWASPFTQVWWIKPLYGSSIGPAIEIHEPARMSHVERWFTTELGERIVADRPEFVLVDTGRASEYGGKPFPYIDYLSQISSFRTLWRQYQRAGSLDRFEVWERVPSS